jgi:hypothetical protein
MSNGDSNVLRQFINPSYMPGDYQNQPTGDLYSQNQINPMMHGMGGETGGVNTTSRQAPQTGSPNYMDQYNAMLAPYQAAAQKFASPYAVFPPNSQFTAQHPLLARGIDRGILAASMVPAGPGPRSIGQGIAGVAQGLTGANEFYRQRALQAMMLPYQMMGPRLQQMDVMSQIGERSAMIPYYTKRAGYYDVMQDVMQQRQATAEQRADIAQQAQNTKEAHQNWLEGNDPKSPFSGRSGDQTWKNVLTGNPRFEGEDDATYAQRLDQIYQEKKIQVASALGGATTTARQKAEQPFKDLTDFYTQGERTAMAGLDKPLPPEQYYASHQFNLKMEDELGGPGGQKTDHYGDYVRDFAQKKAEQANLVQQWRSDPTVAKNRISFQDWQRLRSGQPASQAAPQTQQKALSWNPKTGKYE